MKNQYLGDNRDLFKYDLVLKIINARLARNFNFVPMLTPDETDNKNGRREGEQRNRSKAKAGWKNRELVEFLDRFNNENKRDINKLHSYFRSKKCPMKIYEDYFNHPNRHEYFRKLKQSLIPKSLICIDPDNGLEVKRSREKHIMYSEVKDLYGCIDKTSILMLFQYIPREKRDIFFKGICEKLEHEIGCWPIYISDNQIVFFFLTKDKSLRASLSNTLNDYVDFYPELIISEN